MTQEEIKELDEAAEKYRRDSCNAAMMPNIDGPMPEYGGSVKDAFKTGAIWDKEQMMNEAVEGKVCAVYPLKTCNEIHYSVQYPIGILPHKDGNKVKLIIIKES